MWIDEPRRLAVLTGRTHNRPLKPSASQSVYCLGGLSPRRMLVADEVGLGKTIETGMLIRELIARGNAERILIVTPAGLIENWRRELEGQFRLLFDVLGRDFQDHGSATWERHGRVIASIDALKQPRRLQRLLAAPMWDMVIFDEAHHLSRTRSDKKTVVTQNYRLAEALRNHTRDLLFLSATRTRATRFNSGRCCNCSTISCFRMRKRLQGIAACSGA